jgi:hypothetical protein
VVLRCTRKGAQLDRLDSVLPSSVIQLPGMKVPPTSFGYHRREPECVGALVALVSYNRVKPLAAIRVGSTQVRHAPAAFIAHGSRLR